MVRWFKLVVVIVSAQQSSSIMDHVEAFENMTAIIKKALAAPGGKLRLANAENVLIDELERNRFNTERAIEIYTIAIDNSVWAWCKDLPLGRSVYREYQRAGLGPVFS
jgi:hypothetical protein